MKGLLFLACFVVLAWSRGEYLPGLMSIVDWSNVPRKASPHGRSQLRNRAQPAALSNVRQITHGGTNAECYWNNAGDKFSFQAIPANTTHPCDQIFTMTTTGADVTAISALNGRTTCSFILDDGRVLYSSTAVPDSSTASKACPATPDASAGYLWPVYPEMSIYIGQPGGVIDATIFSSDAYDAESTLSPDGKQIVFTSARDGDLELYIGNLDGTGLRRMTYSPGYDGGAFFTRDGKRLVWRASRPQGQALTDYRNKLALGVVEPIGMQLFVMEIDNPASARMIGPYEGTNFCPSSWYDDSRLLFTSDMHAPNTGSFQIYSVNYDGSDLRQLTTDAEWGTFNAFQLGSPTNKTLAWCSNRDAKQPGEINVYLADFDPAGGIPVDLKKPSIEL